MSILDDIKAGKVDSADLFEYVSGNDVGLAIAAASAPNADGPTLELAAMDLDYRVRLAAAKNINTDKDTLDTLCLDENDEVAQQAQLTLEKQAEQGG